MGWPANATCTPRTDGGVDVEAGVPVEKRPKPVDVTVLGGVPDALGKLAVGEGGDIRRGPRHLSFGVEGSGGERKKC